MNASAFPSRRRHTRTAPSFRPEHTAPRNSNAAHTVIPTGADRTPQLQTLPTPSFRPKQTAPRNSKRCPHRHSDRSRPIFFFRVRFLRTRRSA
jgi:hypothetical protein